MTANEIAVRTKVTELTVREDQVGWDPKQVAALRQLGIKDDVSNADLAVFFHFAKRTGLDPFARQIYMIGRWDNQSGRERQSIQTGIDGFRVIARRAADRSGIDYGMRPTLWCGEDGVWRDVWLARTPPAACKVTIVRNGLEFPAVALFGEYAARKRDGSLTGQWPSKPGIMIAKCAEALALRMAFPQDLSGIYTTEEMAQADNPASQNSPAILADPNGESKGVVEVGNTVVDGVGPDWEHQVARAKSVEELRRMYREFRRDGAPQEMFTLLTLRAHQLAADPSSDATPAP